MSADHDDWGSEWSDEDVDYEDLSHEVPTRRASFDDWGWKWSDEDVDYEDLSRKVPTQRASPDDLPPTTL